VFRCEGNIGLTGVAGAKGDIGLTGVAGAKGDIGLTGAAGAKGDQVHRFDCVQSKSDQVS